MKTKHSKYGFLLEILPYALLVVFLNSLASCCGDTPHIKVIEDHVYLRRITYASHYEYIHDPNCSKCKELKHENNP